MESYLQQVNKSFEILEKDMLAHEKKGCSKLDVLQYMIDTKDEIVWHPSYSLSGHRTSTGGFLSHRGCARASELGIENPEIVEVRKVGRIHVYRLRRENVEAIKKFLREHK